ncbi:2-C-methyl-D-erythritol 4-phosphate cytidylyltransferase [Vibrio sp.]|nr:2-C-methyl-D-erythritol 4-phosphate cytidylyltransferase [Vibrio sp.]
MKSNKPSITAVVPAAGVGSRMKADKPKQYLSLQNQSILEHTIYKLLSHPNIEHVIVVIGQDDPYFNGLSIASDVRVTCVNGGQERADSVLAGLMYLKDKLSIQVKSSTHTRSSANTVEASSSLKAQPLTTAALLDEWVLVHDAARPCIQMSDIDRLLDTCFAHDAGGILACPVRDTMKRSTSGVAIDHSVDRQGLYHALTPQMFKLDELLPAIENALLEGSTITDEASAMERMGQAPLIVQGRADNIKVTQPEDLALAEFYLQKDK